ncbi:uncharacterized protein KY384_006290 [Bacidia gigantensis]|uniref:uncharacterized protein n=1 Tax=Bacidia gigantensis TaxID=2732470 RepID=UPI001D03C805|nr:uncharacterized protein KY384_006290 [Bacidia gigantensis]KAG8528603.1 hypothetical protein KY384_006290 [Bacidia gigantensis]
MKSRHKDLDNITYVSSKRSRKGFVERVEITFDAMADPDQGINSPGSDIRESNETSEYGAGQINAAQDSRSENNKENIPPTERELLSAQQSNASGDLRSSAHTSMERPGIVDRSYLNEHLEPYNGDVLRLIPSNDMAKRSVHELLECQEAGKLSSHHAQYLTRIDKNQEPKRLIRNLDDTLHGHKAEEPTLHQGYLKLNLQNETVSGKPHFLVGTGSNNSESLIRNVDILVAPPGSHLATKVRADHVMIYMHRDSGAWILETRAPVELDGILVEAHLARALGRPKVLLKLGELQFWLEFSIDSPRMEVSYVKTRDKRLVDAGLDIPWSSHSGIPMRIDTTFETAVFRQIELKPRSNQYAQGFDTRNGNVCIVVKHSVENNVQHLHAIELTEATLSLSSTPGVAALLDVRTLLNEHNIQRPELPFDYYTVQEEPATMFDVIDKLDEPLSEQQLKVMLKDLLTGLSDMHVKGFRHRGIVPSKIHMLDSPTRTVFFDLSSLSVDLPCNYLPGTHENYPPEAIPFGERNFSDKADVCMLGLALVQLWFPEEVDGLVPRQLNGNFILTQRLESLSSPIGRILASMLAWNPINRSGASQLLAHPFFDPKKSLSEAKGDEPGKKRKGLYQDSSDNKRQKIHYDDKFSKLYKPR